MKVGLLCGREYSFPPAFVAHVNEAGAAQVGSFCSGLGGSVTAPITLTLAASDGSNICLFRSIKDGDPIILHTIDDFKKSACTPPP